LRGQVQGGEKPLNPNPGGRGERGQTLEEGRGRERKSCGWEGERWQKRLTIEAKETYCRGKKDIKKYNEDST